MASEFAYVFEGDGREMVEPLEGWEMPGWPPTAVRRATARRLGQMFEERGISTHSPQGATMWVIIAYAQYKGFGIQIEGVLGEGYEIRKVH